MATKAMIFQTLLAGLRFDGATANGYLAYFYVPGDLNTLKTVYADRNKATPAANPYTLDANGRAEIFGDGVYDVVIKTAAGATKATWENVALNDPTSTAVANGVDYASLNAAVTAIGSTPTRLFINAELPVTGNVVIPATLELEFTRAGSLSHGAYTITFSGTDPVTGRHQIFNGTGAVSGLTVSRPEWFGTGDAAMQESMNASAYQIWDGIYTGINTTIEAPSGRDTYITGHGTVSGTANPLLKSSLPLADFFEVHGVNFTVASAQTALSVLKTWTATPLPSFLIDGVTVTSTHADAVGIVVDGAREGKLSNLTFYRDGYNGTGKALSFVGHADSGAMNIKTENLDITGWAYGVHADGPDSLYLAGLAFANATIIGAGTPIYAQNVNDLRFTNLMSDNNQNAIELINIDSGAIVNAYINAVAANEPGVKLIANSTANLCRDFAFDAVKVYENDQSADKDGINITATGASVTMRNITVDGSTFVACDTGVYAAGVSSGTVNGLKVSGSKFDTSNKGIWNSDGSINSVNDNNTFTTVGVGITNAGIQNTYLNSIFEPDVTTRVASTGNGAYFGPSRVNGAWTRNSGIATFNGDGGTTFSIPHGLPLAPNKELSVLPGSEDALASFWVTNDATNIIVTLSGASPVGTDNIIFYWTAECLLE